MTIKNIDDSIVFGAELYTKRVIFHNEQILTFMLNFCAGQSLPTHKHEVSTIVLLVENGKGEMKLNGRTYDLEKGNVVLLKGEDEWGICKVTENLTIFVNISPAPADHRYAMEIG